MFCLISCSRASMAMLVLPAPVGARTSRFWLLFRAVDGCGSESCSMQATVRVRRT